MSRPIVKLPCLDYHETRCNCYNPSVKYPASIELFRQDEISRAVFYIDRGTVKLTRDDESGQTVIVGLRRTGWLLGAPSVILGKPYSTTAVTLTSCLLRCIPSDQFMEMVAKNDRFSHLLNRVFSYEIYQHVEKIACLALSPARQCLEKIICDLADSSEPEITDGQNPIKLKLDLKNWELAQLIGVTPEYICRILKQMEDEGLICRHKGWLVVPDPRKIQDRHKH